MSRDTRCRPDVRVLVTTYPCNVFPNAGSYAGVLYPDAAGHDGVTNTERTQLCGRLKICTSGMQDECELRIADLGAGNPGCTPGLSPSPFPNSTSEIRNSQSSRASHLRPPTAYVPDG